MKNKNIPKPVFLLMLITFIIFQGCRNDSPGIKNDPKAYAKAKLITGQSLKEKYPDSSWYFFTDALKIADANSLDSLKVNIFYDMAGLYYYVNDYRKYVALLDSALFHAVRVNDYEMMSNICNEQGTIKLDLSDSVDAEALFKKSYEIAGKNHLRRQQAISLSNLARFKKNPDERSDLNLKALALLGNDGGSAETRASILVNLANVSPDPDTAIRYYYSAINSVDSEGSYLVHIGAYNNLAYSFLEKKNYREAEKCIVEYSMPLAIKHQNNDWLATLYDTYADIMMETGNYRAGLEAEKNAYRERVSAYNKHATGQVRLLAALLDVKNREIHIQSVERELSRKKSNIRILGVSLTGFVIFTIIFIIYLIQNNRLKIQNKALSSAREIIGIEEKMKEKLAMELHDLTSPLSYGLKNLSSNNLIRGTEAEKDFIRLHSLADTLRQLSHKISMNGIDKMSFSDLVKNFCADMQKMAPGEIQVYVAPGIQGITAENELHLIRIIQELLTNGVKHAGKSMVELSVSNEQKKLFIIYDDAGQGFDYDSKKLQGLGLNNIFERTKLLGGKAVLRTKPGNGTHWIISVPL